MSLDKHLEGFEPTLQDKRKKLAKEKSYAILNHIKDTRKLFDSFPIKENLFGSTAPSVFVGRSNYPNVSTGILAPLNPESDASNFATSSDWYHKNLQIEDILQYRIGLLNSNRSMPVNVYDVWDGFVGVQREVAISAKPVDIELSLANKPKLDFSPNNITAAIGFQADVISARIVDNPKVLKPVEAALSDDDLDARGAISFLYKKGLDVYDIHRIFSVGAMGLRDQRRLVPTRWSITAVDDMVGKSLHKQVCTFSNIDGVTVWRNSYIGNTYWVFLIPGTWEFELIEIKSPGSVWNPSLSNQIWISSEHEGYYGRASYAKETAGAYYAARLGVLEHLISIKKQCKCLVIREVSDAYWAPVGVWQIRESVRNAFREEPYHFDNFHTALNQISISLSLPLGTLKSKSTILTGIQSKIADFSPHS